MPPQTFDLVVLDLCSFFKASQVIPVYSQISEPCSVEHNMSIIFVFFFPLSPHFVRQQKLKYTHRELLEISFLSRILMP